MQVYTIDMVNSYMKYQHCRFDQQKSQLQIMQYTL